MACHCKSHREASEDAALSIQATRGMWSTTFVDDFSAEDGVNSPFDKTCAPSPSESDRSTFEHEAFDLPKNFVWAQFPSRRYDVEMLGRLEEPTWTGAIKRRVYLRRNIDPVVYSTEKLFLSRRMARIMKNSSLKLSPIKATNLAHDFQHSQVSRIIRDTRGGTVISPK